MNENELHTQEFREINHNLGIIAALLEVQARISVAELNAKINPGAVGLKQYTFEEFTDQLKKETIDNEEEIN